MNYHCKENSNDPFFCSYANIPVPVLTAWFLKFVVCFACPGQAGFIGAWGEWHSSVHHLEDNHTELARLVAKELYEWWPQGARQVLVRVPRYKENWLLMQSVPEHSQWWTRGVVDVASQHSKMAFARIGYHDDGFMNAPSDGGTWPEPPDFANPGNPQFDYMTLESPYVPVDGEMYWNSGTAYPVVDGMDAVHRLRLHHFTTFSIVHGLEPLGWTVSSKKIQNERQVKNSKNESINIWMTTPLNTTAIANVHLPMSPAYASKPHSVFDYIRDHLGYRIELQSASYSITPFIEHNITFDATAVNYGFSAPINMRVVYLVFISKTAKAEVVWGSLVASCDPRTWQPYQPGDPEYFPLEHKIHHYAALPSAIFGNSWMLGLHISDQNSTATPWKRTAAFSVRFANQNADWWVDADGNGGINILGTVVVPS